MAWKFGNNLRPFLIVIIIIFLQVCKISVHLQKSKILINCSNELIELKDLDVKKRQKILERSGQFEIKTVEGINICTSHLDSLTSKLRKDPKCLAESHFGTIRLKASETRKEISPTLSLHVQKHTGFLLPSGGLICQKCRKQIFESLPPLPKKPKVEKPLPKNRNQL